MVVFVTGDDLLLLQASLARIETAIASLSAQITNQGALLMSTANSLDTAISALQADVASETTVNQSAITLIQGFPALIATAVAQAQAAGATPAELAAVTALGTSISANATSLAAAVTANTSIPPTS